MVWSCKIVPQWFTAVFTKENSTCIFNLCHNLKWICGYNFHMFRSNLVRCLNGSIQIRGNQDVTVVFQRFLNDRFSGEHFTETIYFFGYFFCQLFTGSDQNGRCQLIMFCLGQQISRNKTWIGSFVSQNKNLTRTCNGINADMTEYGFFCKGYIDISRSRQSCQLLEYFRYRRQVRQ